MKVLVVGSGGREHAIAWKLLQSPEISQVFCIPGNGGTAALNGCKNILMRSDDFEGIARFASVQGVGLVVVGPEQPLATGITDYLKAQNLTVFGPTQEGARIEASKFWAKELMRRVGIPTAKAQTFTDPDKAKDYIAKQGAPIVIKADGLAAGKGVIVAKTLTEAQNGVDNLWEQGFKTLLVEEFLQGQEVSILALVDGITFRTLLPSQDYKRIGDGDKGENTGGMGAYSPVPFVTPQLMEQIDREIIAPTLEALKSRGIDYRGVLYAGLMITPDGSPKVLEFNCRFGDPETQAILPLLNTPLDKLLFACAKQSLGTLPPLEWKEGYSVCVVAAAAGYPGSFKKGEAITGIRSAHDYEAIVFHAGTKQKDKQLVTNGGRVLGVTAMGQTLDDAVSQTYKAVSCIEFEGIYYRHDIGQRPGKKLSRSISPPPVPPVETATSPETTTSPVSEVTTSPPEVTTSPVSEVTTSPPEVTTSLETTTPPVSEVTTSPPEVTTSPETTTPPPLTALKPPQGETATL